MLRRILVAAVAAAVLAPTAAHASSGWARYDADTWVRWHTRAGVPAAGEDVTPAWHRELRAFLDARFTAIRESRIAHRTWLAERAAALAALRAAEAAAEAAAVRQAAEHAQSVNVAQAPNERDVGHPGGSLRAMVCSFAWSCSVASCIVERESGWNPRAYNPRSGSAGLFQLMPMWYRGWDPFNPYANASHAYALYRSSGWAPWNGGQYSCGF